MWSFICLDAQRCSVRLLDTSEVFDDISKESLDPSCQQLSNDPCEPPGSIIWRWTIDLQYTCMWLQKETLTLPTPKTKHGVKLMSSR